MRPSCASCDFGTVRRERRPRLKWLDLHNLLGIVTLAWAFMVGATGMINTWADLIIKYWQYDQLSALLAPYQGQPTVPMAERGSVQRSLDVALERAPGMKLSFIAFPGTAFSSPHHNTRLPARQRAASPRACCSRCWSMRKTGAGHRQPASCPGT